MSNTSPLSLLTSLIGNSNSSQGGSAAASSGGGPGGIGGNGGVNFGTITQTSEGGGGGGGSGTGDSTAVTTCCQNPLLRAIAKIVENLFGGGCPDVCPDACPAVCPNACPAVCPGGPTTPFSVTAPPTTTAALGASVMNAAGSSSNEAKIQIHQDGSLSLLSPDGTTVPLNKESIDYLRQAVAAKTQEQSVAAPALSQHSMNNPGLSTPSPKYSNYEMERFQKKQELIQKVFLPMFGGGQQTQSVGRNSRRATLRVP